MGKNPALNEENVNKLFQNAQKFSDKKMFAEAEKGYQFLLKILPNHPHILSSYGKHNLNQKKFDIAEKYIKQAIKISPDDTHVLLDFAAYYSGIEDYKNYVFILEKTFLLAPTNPYVIANLAYYFLASREYDKLKTLCNEASKYEVDIIDLEVLKIAHAVILYLENNKEKCEALLTNMCYFSNDKAMNTVDQFSLRKTFRAYYLYSLSLLNWHKNNPAYSSSTTTSKVYIIGDSHSFGAANISTSKYTLSAKLILDTSAWQLTYKKMKKHAFKEALSSIEKGAEIIVSFGEIDCRVNVGIHKHHLKNPQKNMAESIKSLVKDYVALVVKYAKNRSLDVQLLNCPAPLKSFILTQIEDEENIAAYLTIPKQWNEELSKQAALHGLKVVDIYSATHGVNGWSKDYIHLDNVHFKPNILVDLLNK